MCRVRGDKFSILAAAIYSGKTSTSLRNGQSKSKVGPARRSRDSACSPRLLEGRRLDDRVWVELGKSAGGAPRRLELESCLSTSCCEYTERDGATKKCPRSCTLPPPCSALSPSHRGAKPARCDDAPHSAPSNCPAPTSHKLTVVLHLPAAAVRRLLEFLCVRAPADAPLSLASPTREKNHVNCLPRR
jgi:hypothetical protein